MSSPVTLTVDFVSDVVCPWCYLGKHRLDAAMARLPDVTFEVRFRPFQLDPTVPPEGRPHKETLAAKFGSRARVDAAHRSLTELGAAVDIDFDFDAVEKQINSLDAHRVLRWATEAEVAPDMAEILFRRYFADGEDISDHAILAEAAEEAGMDGEDVADWLTTDVDTADVHAEIAQSQRMGITGVPCFIIEGKYAVMGAQETQALVDAFTEIAAEKRFGPKA